MKTVCRNLAKYILGKGGIPKQKGRNNYSANRIKQQASKFEKKKKAQIPIFFPRIASVRIRDLNVQSKNKITRRKCNCILNPRSIVLPKHFTYSWKTEIIKEILGTTL